jgi:hypothetical protein
MLMFQKQYINLAIHMLKAIGKIKSLGYFSSSSYVYRNATMDARHFPFLRFFPISEKSLLVQNRG